MASRRSKLPIVLAVAAVATVVVVAVAASSNPSKPIPPPQPPQPPQPPPAPPVPAPPPADTVPLPPGLPPLREPPENLPAFDLPSGIRVTPRFQTDAQVAPMIVVLHSRGADENELSELIPKNIPARVFFLRGPLENPNKGVGGRMFFTPRLTDPELDVTLAIRNAGKTVWATLAQLQALYSTSQVIAVGYGEGAALALYLAALGAVEAAVAFSGALPATLYPRGPADVNVRAWHGAADVIVPEKMDAATIDAFAKAGYPAAVYEVRPGVGHVKPPPAVVANYLAAALTPLPADETGLEFPAACTVDVVDRDAATVRLARFFVDAGRALQEADQLIDPQQLLGEYFAQLVPDCKLDALPPVDAESAAALYWAIRTGVRALVLRGFVEPPVAAKLLTDLAAGAQKAGAKASELPPLEL